MSLIRRDASDVSCTLETRCGLSCALGIISAIESVYDRADQAEERRGDKLGFGLGYGRFEVIRDADTQNDFLDHARSDEAVLQLPQKVCVGNTTCFKIDDVAKLHQL